MPMKHGPSIKLMQLVCTKQGLHVAMQCSLAPYQGSIGIPHPYLQTTIPFPYKVKLKPKKVSYWSTRNATGTSTARRPRRTLKRKKEQWFIKLTNTQPWPAHGDSVQGNITAQSTSFLFFHFIYTTGKMPGLRSRGACVLKQNRITCVSQAASSAANYHPCEMNSGLGSATSNQ